MATFQVIAQEINEKIYTVEASDEDEAVEFVNDDLDGTCSSVVTLEETNFEGSEIQHVEKISWQVFYLCTIVITVKQILIACTDNT